MDETENTNVENFAQALCESALGAGSWQFAKQIPRLRTRYMRRAAVGVVWLSTCARAAGYSPEDLPGVHAETASVEDFREALRGGAERAQALKDENERLRSVVRSMEKDTTILAGIMSEAWPGKAFPGYYPTARDTVDILRRGGCSEYRVALLAAAKLLWPDAEPGVCPTAEQLTEGIRKAIEDAVSAAIAGGRGV